MLSMLKTVVSCNANHGMAVMQYPKRQGVVKGRDHLAGGKWRCSEYLGGSMDSPREHEEALF
jgi:hypothetical protein